MTTEQDFLAAADKYGVGHAGKSLWRWIENGISPGGFLTAVLRNDLSGAVGKADDRNVELIPNFVRLLHNHAPAGCWGSEQKFYEWTYELDRLMIHTESWKGGYRASLYAFPDRGPDAPASIMAHIIGPDDHLDLYEAGQDLDHALEAVAAARNSGFNFDRFRAEQRLAAADERGELDIY